MTNRDHRLSFTCQAAMLGISRGSLYYGPRLVNDDDFKLMRWIDGFHMDYPFAPSRNIAPQYPAGQWATGW